MQTEQSTLVTTVTYSDDRGNRYLLTKQWNNELPKATIIMLSPSISGAIQQDITTTCIINCTSKLGYGSVDIVNIFSRLDIEISTEMDTTNLSDDDNIKTILESSKTSDTIVLAWGKCDLTNLAIKAKVKDMMNVLSLYQDKLYLIGDDKGRSGFSPMYPKIRNN